MWYPAVTVSPPAQEPLDLVSVKQFLRIDADNTFFDLEVNAAMIGARGAVESGTGSRLITQDVSVQADRWEDLAHLPIGPVQDLLAINWRRRDTADTPIDIATVERFGGGVGQGLRPVPGSRWPGEHWPYRGDCWEWREGRRHFHDGLLITVQLRVGYGDDPADLPADLSIALLLAARGIYDDKAVDLSAGLAPHQVWR